MCKLTEMILVALFVMFNYCFLAVFLKVLCSALRHAFRRGIVNVWKSFAPATVFIIFKYESSRKVLNGGHADEQMK